jgi:hypothetical protein
MPSFTELGIDPRELEGSYNRHKSVEEEDAVIVPELYEHADNLHNSAADEHQSDTSRDRGVYESLEQALLDGFEQHGLEGPISDFMQSAKNYKYITTADNEVLRLTREVIDEAGGGLELIRMRKVEFSERPFKLPFNNKPSKIESKNVRIHHQEEQYKISPEKLILHRPETGSSVNLLARLPETSQLFERGDKCAAKLDGQGAYIFESRQIEVNRIRNGLTLAQLLHEAGHAWDDVLRPELNQRVTEIDEEYRLAQNQDAQQNLEVEYIKATISAERQAWAWALREIRRLRDVGFRLEDSVVEQIEQRAEASLQTYEFKTDTVFVKEFFSNTMRALQRRIELIPDIYATFTELLDGKPEVKIDLTSEEAGEGVVLWLQRLEDSNIKVAITNDSLDTPEPMDYYTVGPHQAKKHVYDSEHQVSRVDKLDFASLSILLGNRGQVPVEEFPRYIRAAQERARQMDLLVDMHNFAKQQSTVPIS